jgi:hypothetical protein
VIEIRTSPTFTRTVWCFGFFGFLPRPITGSMLGDEPGFSRLALAVVETLFDTL